MSSNSIALRLSGMFSLVALVIFLLIGGALYQQVDRGLGLLPGAELDARYSVLESSITRFGTQDHWGKMANKLKLLGEEDKRIRFWVVSSDPTYEYGNPDARQPEYDFGKVLASERNLRVARTTLGKQERSPAYVPPPPKKRPWTEEHPALLWTVLITAVLGLGGISVRILMRAGSSPNSPRV